LVESVRFHGNILVYPEAQPMAQLAN
jgi:hypothetical protein